MSIRRTAFLLVIAAFSLLVAQPVSAAPESSAETPADLTLPQASTQANGQVVVGRSADPAPTPDPLTPPPTPDASACTAGDPSCVAGSGTPAPAACIPGASPTPAPATPAPSGGGAPDPAAGAPLCTSSAASGSGGGGIPDQITSTFMSSINNAAIAMAVGDDGNEAGGLLGYVVNMVLGTGNTMFDPVVSCREASANARAGCGDWFIKQYGIMRQMGLLLIAPLMMLVIIQSIVRGSMFLLLRSTLILLPTAFIGSVVIAAFAQMLLNISDSLASAMFAASGSNFDQVRDGIRRMDAEGMSWFSLLFLVVMAISALVIIIEMIIREIGVYLSVLFMPMLFAGLVWPASASAAKRAIEILGGLIFSKVFIAGGLALGLGAIEAGAGGTSASQVGLMAAVNAAVIFIIAGVFGVRLLMWVPGGSGAQEGRIANPTGVFGMGEFTQQAQTFRLNTLSRRINKATPTQRS